MEIKEFKVKNAYPDNREWLDDFQLHEKVVTYKGEDIAIISLLMSEYYGALNLSDKMELILIILQC